tara:strand:+ start:19503 stop:20129 length:627 start_codon:yes stop_codon:yes gene_type:complete
MIINTKRYKLTKKNYIPQGTKKNKIVIGVTYSNNMSHYTGWSNRNNGAYTRTAMFTVSMDGKVYEHFSPNYFSDFMLKPDLNESSITILLENEGWLIKDLTNENKYINYVGHIYNRKDSVINKRWRNQTYWAPFTDKQVDSTIKLVAELCKNFNIPMNVVSHNTNLDDAQNFNGVLYRSNFEKYYTDITPAWDFKYFKNKLEKNKQHG